MERDEEPEDPETIKGWCINQLKEAVDFTTESLANFSVVTNIPRELTIQTEDTLRSVFGSASPEMKRLRDQGDSWNSLEEKTRRDWLVQTRACLKAALKRVEKLPPKRLVKLGIGVIENDRLSGPSVAQKLGITTTNTTIGQRLLELCRRAQINVIQSCPDSTAFLLRKMLEITIIERFRAAKRGQEIMENGRYKGLRDIVGLASASANGWIHPTTVEKLLDEKHFLDLAVHNTYYEPSADELDRIMSTMKAALTDLQVNQL